MDNENTKTFEDFKAMLSGWPDETLIDHYKGLFYLVDFLGIYTWEDISEKFATLDILADRGHKDKVINWQNNLLETGRF